MLNLAKPPRIVHPYPFDLVASNPLQDFHGRARCPQGLLGGQIVGMNECIQIPERLLQDVLGAYQLLLTVKDITLQRGHCVCRCQPCNMHSAIRILTMQRTCASAGSTLRRGQGYRSLARPYVGPAVADRIPKPEFVEF
jgi:hypothetical protein